MGVSSTTPQARGAPLYRAWPAAPCSPCRPTGRWKLTGRCWPHPRGGPTWRGGSSCGLAHEPKLPGAGRREFAQTLSGWIAATPAVVAVGPGFCQGHSNAAPASARASLQRPRDRGVASALVQQQQVGRKLPLRQRDAHRLSAGASTGGLRLGVQTSNPARIRGGGGPCRVRRARRAARHAPSVSRRGATRTIDFARAPRSVPVRFAQLSGHRFPRGRASCFTFGGVGRARASRKFRRRPLDIAAHRREAAPSKFAFSRGATRRPRLTYQTVRRRPATRQPLILLLPGRPRVRGAMVPVKIPRNVAEGVALRREAWPLLKSLPRQRDPAAPLLLRRTHAHGTQRTLSSSSPPTLPH